MIDFAEAWNLRNRLINDGYLTPYDDITDGEGMEKRIAELAHKYYNWKWAQPSQRMGMVSSQYKAELENQTANDRLCHIWEVAVDWDGFCSVRTLGALIDEILDYTAIKCKSMSRVIEEMRIFNSYDNIADFLGAQSYPLYWSYPPDKFNEIRQYCRANDIDVHFVCENRDDDGNVVAVVLRIKRKEDINDII